MTHCTFGRDALLRADPVELAGTLETELGRHIAGCARCREAAERLLASNRLLDDFLDLAPALDVDALLARAALGPVDGSGAGGFGDPTLQDPTMTEDAPGDAAQKTDRHRLRTRWHRWTVVAAAASVAALLVARSSERPLPGAASLPVVERYPTFELPAGRDVAVFQTDNPDITVLWFFPGG